MANRIQHLRGSLTEHSTFTGEKGEISLVTDTSANRIPTGELRIHDGSTAGGLEVPGVARAWVNFDGTLAMTVGSSYGPDAPPADYSSPNPIRAAYNVDYIIDRGTGDYEIHFETAMPNANYAVTGITNGNALAERASNYICLDYKNNGTGTQPSTTSIRINTGAMSSQNYAAVIQDAPHIMVVIFH